MQRSKMEPAKKHKGNGVSVNSQALHEEKDGGRERVLKLRHEQSRGRAGEQPKVGPRGAKAPELLPAESFCTGKSL